jgi:hypothetical protein
MWNIDSFFDTYALLEKENETVNVSKKIPHTATVSQIWITQLWKTQQESNNMWEPILGNVVSLDEHRKEKWINEINITQKENDNFRKRLMSITTNVVEFKK